MRQTFFLSRPPSVNEMYFNRTGKGRNRAPTAKYKSWLNDMGWRLKLQRAEKMKGEILIYVSVYKPDKRKRDLDNSQKGLWDLLVKQEIIPDDSNIVHACLKWKRTSKPHLDFHGEPADVMVKLAEVGE